MRTPFRHQRIAAAFADGNRHFRIRIVHVAEQTRAGRARHYTRGFAFAFRQLLVINAIHAQRAFLHYLLVLVDFTRAVRTRPRAIFAADALVVVHQHDAIRLAFVTRTGRTHRHARRVFAMQAAFGKMNRVGVREFADFISLHAGEKRAGGLLCFILITNIHQSLFNRCVTLLPTMYIM